MSTSSVGRFAATHSHIHRNWLCCALGVIAFSMGCGGGKPAKPVRPQGAIVVQPPIAAPPPVVAHVPPPLSNEPAAFDEPTGPDDFEILPHQDEPRWEVVGEVSDLTSVLVSELPDETDSSSFVKVLPPIVSSQMAPRGIPEGYTAVPGCDITNEGIPLRITGGKAGVEMAYIQAGVFLRGDDFGPQESSPQQSVFLDAFYMDLTEVTLEEYERFRQDLAQQKKQSRPPANAEASPSEPALGINWNEATIYARWAGKDLPTEAQWEKAARGPNGFNFPWGNGRPIWQRPREPGQIDPAGSFRADTSPFGVFDLAGNAREWCADKFSDTAYEAERAEGEATLRNPRGPNVASITDHRVLRGGSPDWVVWHRSGELLNKRLPDVGFRCVLNLSGESPLGARPDHDKPTRPGKGSSSGKGKNPGKPR